MSAGVRRRGRASRNRDEKWKLQQGWENDPDAFAAKELQRLPEVRIINKYALVLAYIRFGVRAMGALMLLWATVVLLGGFVSSLRKIDFWCLTTIAFVQAAGLLDAMGNDGFMYFQQWLGSLLWDNDSLGEKHDGTQRPMRKSLSRRIINISLIAIFFPVGFFAPSSQSVCIWISAFRVVKQDYGIADGDASKANLKRAMNLFYCLSIAHAVICILYMCIEMFADIKFVVTVSQQYGFSRQVLKAYLCKTKQMCVDNPASTMNWNLITYGADLLDSQLPQDYASGGRVLTMLIDQDVQVPVTRLLIRSPRQRIQKLIGTLAWRSPEEREMRWLAARIVEHLAGDLNLAHFPGALECIYSLFDTSYNNNGDQEAPYLRSVVDLSKQRKRTGLLNKKIVGDPREDKDDNLKNGGGLMMILDKIHKRYSVPKNGGVLEQDRKQRESSEIIDEDLVLLGLRILENVAHNRHNCALIYNTNDLLSKIVAPVSSNELIEDIKSNTAWTKVVDGSLKVVSRLMGSLGTSGKEMCSLIAKNNIAVENLEAILGINKERSSSVIELQMRAIEVLTLLAFHEHDPANTSVMKRRENIITKALEMFLTTKWMGEYLEDEKMKIEHQTARQQNTLPRPSTRACSDNPVKKLNGARAKEEMIEQAAKARAEEKMKELQESISQLKENAGEALAMLLQSGDSKVIMSFTGCDDVVLCLTALLDSKFKTIQCNIPDVEIKINMGCRISAAVILKQLSNYDQETTLQKVLKELLPIQAEVSSTTTFTGCITATINDDIENPSDGAQGEPSASPSPHIQQCADRRLQAELLSLVAAIRPTNNLDLADVLISQLQPDPDAQEKLGVWLKKIVEDNMYATPACLAIQKLACKMITDVLQHDGLFEVIDKHKIIDTLLEASKAMAGLESSMLFAGVRQDCHGVPLKPLLSVLAKNAEYRLTQRKQAQVQPLAQAISNAPAGVSAP